MPIPDTLPLVLATVNAPYRDPVTAEKLAGLIADPASAERHGAHAFAFFSEVAVLQQIRFLNEMKVDWSLANQTAKAYQQLAGFKIPLASDDYGYLDLDDWAEAMQQDVLERFGPLPENLVDVGEPGW